MLIRVMLPLSGLLRRAYTLAFRRFGHQRWWPGDTPFEVCVGAILVQNTSWTNVERAILNLKAAGVLDAHKLHALSSQQLAQLIRPAGYFNVKAQRLRSFLHVLVTQFDGDLEKLFAGETAAVRELLLGIHGIGPETADSLLLYAGGHHSFVIDAYTQRIFERHGWAGEKRKAGKGKVYDTLKSLCESALSHKRGAERLDYLQDYHAQLVVIGKRYCRTRGPRCEQCPLRPLLRPSGTN